MLARDCELLHPTCFELFYRQVQCKVACKMSRCHEFTSEQRPPWHRHRAHGSTECPTTGRNAAEYLVVSQGFGPTVCSRRKANYRTTLHNAFKANLHCATVRTVAHPKDPSGKAYPVCILCSKGALGSVLWQRQALAALQYAPPTWLSYLCLAVRVLNHLGKECRYLRGLAVGFEAWQCGLYRIPQNISY